MITLASVIETSTLDEAIKRDLLLLAPYLKTVDRLRVQKIVELNSLRLIQLFLLKNKAEIKRLETISVKEKIQPETSVVQPSKTDHKQFTFDEFSWDRLVKQIEQLQPNDLTATSILKNSQFLGQQVAQLPQRDEPPPFLASIELLSDYRQLGQIDSLHVSFLLDDNPSQKIFLFVEKLILLTKKFTLAEKRAIFLLFLRSPLFYKYIFSGLTALNLKTEIPRKTLLNVLHQNDEGFLTISQFEWTVELVGQLRMFAAL